jgi:hypothetical protein
MSEDELIKLLNQGYVCPPSAGPAWRAAYEAGNDMSLLEHSLALSPEERLAEHQQVIDFLLKLNPSIAENGSE